MHRIIKIVALAALALLATAAVANASVSVTNGVGFVGKGDVQTALGYANDAAIQLDAKNITFTETSDVTVTATGVKCAKWDGNFVDPSTVHVVAPRYLGKYRTTTTTFTAIARTNGQGKVTNGWDLSGVKGEPVMTYPGFDSNVGHYCPADEHFAGWVDAAQAFSYDFGPSSGLMVSGNGKTVALPNTPLAAPAV